MLQLNPILIFSQKKKLIYLEARFGGKIFFSFPAHNRTGNPRGNPFKKGSGAPAPYGFLYLSPPDFISEEFRNEFYGIHLPGWTPRPGESLVCEWGEFEEHEMGRVRFALGNPHAPVGMGDHAAWERELLIHAGAEFEKPTQGCIRMGGMDIEKLAAHLIRLQREGIPINCVKKV